MTNSRQAPATVAARQLWFTAAQQVELRAHSLPAPAPAELLVEVLCSAVSAGTELLVYRGQIPQDLPLDATLPSLQQSATYPLQYGYACIGRVKQVGANLPASWTERLVFAFQPHASHFLAPAADVIAVPDDIAAEDAVFLANMETAVSLVQDGSPGLGEQVVVLGQGIVGLLLSALLARHPLTGLFAVEGLPLRCQQAERVGVQQVFNPGSPAELAALKQRLASATGQRGADLIFETSGVPSALNLAIELSGYTSRIVIGSWYGNKSAAIALGGEAHRNRLQLCTSQVSTLAPELSGRWDKSRRFALCWDLLRQLRPSQFITHRFAIDQAATLYQQLHQGPGDILQAVFVYSPQAQ